MKMKIFIKKHRRWISQMNLDILFLSTLICFNNSWNFCLCNCVILFGFNELSSSADDKWLYIPSIEIFSKDLMFSNCWTNLLHSNPYLDIPVSTLRCKGNFNPKCLPMLLQIKHSLILLIVGIRSFLKHVIRSLFV